MTTATYGDDMSGILFEETEKRSEKSPDYTGNLTIEGTRYRIAGWNRQGKVKNFISIKISEIESLQSRETVLEDIDERIDISSIPF